MKLTTATAAAAVLAALLVVAYARPDASIHRRALEETPAHNTRVLSDGFHRVTNSFVRADDNSNTTQATTYSAEYNPSLVFDPFVNTDIVDVECDGSSLTFVLSSSTAREALKRFGLRPDLVVTLHHGWICPAGLYRIGNFDASELDEFNINIPETSKTAAASYFVISAPATQASIADVFRNLHLNMSASGVHFEEATPLTTDSRAIKLALLAHELQPLFELIENNATAKDELMTALANLAASKDSTRNRRSDDEIAAETDADAAAASSDYLDEPTATTVVTADGRVVLAASVGAVQSMYTVASDIDAAAAASSIKGTVIHAMRKSSPELDKLQQDALHSASYANVRERRCGKAEVKCWINKVDDLQDKLDKMGKELDQWKSTANTYQAAANAAQQSANQYQAAASAAQQAADTAQATANQWKNAADGYLNKLNVVTNCFNGGKKILGCIMELIPDASANMNIFTLDKNWSWAVDESLGCASRDGSLSGLWSGNSTDTQAVLDLIKQVLKGMTITGRLRVRLDAAIVLRGIDDTSFSATIGYTFEAGVDYTRVFQAAVSLLAADVNLFTAEKTYLITIGPIPVIVTVETEINLGVNVDVSGSAELAATASAGVTGTVTAGLGTSSTQTLTPSSNAAVTKIAVKDVRASVAVTLTPVLNAYFYEIGGPSLRSPLLLEAVATGVHSETQLAQYEDPFMSTIERGGPWGVWDTNTVMCPPGSFINGASIRFQASCGTCDDTGANGLRITCGPLITPSLALGPYNVVVGQYGDWSTNANCPTGYLACGFQTRVDPDQGVNDDTSLNGLKFKCCSTGSWKTQSEVTVHAGTWGNWDATFAMCPFGSYLSAALSRYDTFAVSKDSTGLNALRFTCTNRAVYEITGPFGAWDNGFTDCPDGSYISGLTVRYDSCTACDRTSANGLKMQCSNPSKTYNDLTINPGFFGTWQTRTACPAGYMACGLNARIEGDQGGNDDSSLNGIRVHCCLATNWNTQAQVEYTGGFGSWAAAPLMCPANQFIASMMTRMDGVLGSDGDDTGLNGIRFTCRTYCPAGQILTTDGSSCQTPSVLELPNLINIDITFTFTLQLGLATKFENFDIDEYVPPTTLYQYTKAVYSKSWTISQSDYASLGGAIVGRTPNRREIGNADCDTDAVLGEEDEGPKGSLSWAGERIWTQFNNSVQPALLAKVDVHHNLYRLAFSLSQPRTASTRMSCGCETIYRFNPTSSTESGLSIGELSVHHDQSNAAGCSCGPQSAALFQPLSALITFNGADNSVDMVVAYAADAVVYSDLAHLSEFNPRPQL